MKAEDVARVLEKFGRESEEGRAALNARMVTLLAEEAASPDSTGVYWLSFVSEEDGFLGVVITRADGPMFAIARSRELGINPGGEVAAYGPLPAGVSLTEGDFDRLLNKEETEEINSRE